MIGWDEILEGGLAPNATVMSWRGIKGGIEAAKAKHDVIMTPTDYCYLDYGQGDPATEPLNIGGYVPLEKVYSFDPVPKELSSDEAKYIIGGQANVWTEYLKTPSDVEYMGFPRVLALSEVLWSQPQHREFADFQKRLSSQFARLDKQNVNYRIPEPSGLRDQVLGPTENAVLDIQTRLPRAEVFYSINGAKEFKRYEQPVFLETGTNNRVDVRVIVGLPAHPAGRLATFSATYLRRLWLHPEPDLKEKRTGVTFGLSTTDGGTALIASGETKSIGLQQFAKSADLKQPFAVSFNGYFNAPIDGIYEFQVESTWDTSILIGGEKLIDASGSAERKTRSELIPLKAGFHKISLRYNHRGGEPFWRVRWAIKGQNWRNISGGELVH